MHRSVLDSRRTRRGYSAPEEHHQEASPGTRLSPSENPPRKQESASQRTVSVGVNVRMPRGGVHKDHLRRLNGILCSGGEVQQGHSDGGSNKTGERGIQDERNTSETTRLSNTESIPWHGRLMQTHDPLMDTHAPPMAKAWTVRAGRHPAVPAGETPTTRPQTASARTTGARMPATTNVHLRGRQTAGRIPHWQRPCSLLPSP